MEAKSLCHGMIRRRTWVVTRFFCALWMLVSPPLLGANFYAGISPANVPWPGGIVPYEFTNALTSAQTNTYLDGLREWQLAANVSFVPHTTQTHWILFTYNTNGFDTPSVAEVEFSDDQGRTYAMAALRSEELIRLHHRPYERVA